MNKKLDVAIQDHLEQFSLAPEQIAHWTGQLESVLESKRHTSGKNRYGWPLSMAASLLGIIVGVILTLNMLDQPNSADLIQQIADEVAENHLRKRPLEIEARQIAQVQAYFTQLDFAPTLSPVFAEIIQAQLSGGRYCSIQGVTAAQLRYLDEQGKYVTLFETAYDPAVFSQLPNVDKGEKPLQIYARGVEVNLWVEKGLLMAAVK